MISVEKGKRPSVVIDVKQDENRLEYIKDLEDALDLLKAEREATDSIPYEIFRGKFVKGRRP